MNDDARTEFAIDASVWRRIFEVVERTNALTSSFGLRGLQSTEQFVDTARSQAWGEISALVLAAQQGHSVPAPSVKPQ